MKMIKKLSGQIDWKWLIGLAVLVTCLGIGGKLGFDYAFKSGVQALINLCSTKQQPIVIQSERGDTMVCFGPKAY